MRRALVILAASMVLGLAGGLGGWFVFNWLVPPLQADALVLPPKHAATPARVINLFADDTRPILAGSTAVIRITGRRADALSITQGNLPIAIERGPSGTYWAEQPLDGNTGLTFTVGDHSRTIALPLLPDTPPHIDWVGRPSINTSGTVRLPFVARDDVSLQDISLLVTAGTPDANSSATIPLKQHFPAGTKISERTFHVDLLTHRLSGQNANLTLIAKDGAGQIVASAPAFIRLPSARLKDRTAQMIASLADELAQKPNATNKIALLLTSVAFTPKDYDHDLTAFLGLRIAYRRLTGLSLLYTPPKYPLPPASADQVAEIRPLLIDIARHVDAGPSQANRTALQIALARAERALDLGGQEAQDATALRQAAFGFLGYGIADYLGGVDPLETMVPWQLLAQRLLIAIDEAAERGLQAEAYKGFDLLQDLLENALPNTATANTDSALGSFAQMGHEAAALKRLTQRLEHADNGPYADIRATTQRRINALRNLAASSGVPGNTVLGLRKTMTILDEVDKTLASQNKSEALQQLKAARHQLTETGHIAAGEMVRRLEGKLIAARLPALPLAPADKHVDGPADISTLAAARLADCAARRQGPCAPEMRERLERLRHSAP